MKNKKLFAKIMLVLLVLTICISPLSACKKTKPSNNSSVDSVVDNTGDDTIDSSQEEYTDSSYEEYPMDSSSEDYVDYPSDDFSSEQESYEDYQSDDYEDIPLEDMYEEDLEDLFKTEILVSNASEPITNTFRGVSGTVHFPYTYWQHTTGIGIYSQKLADYEFDRMRDTGYKYVRALLKDAFVWDKKKGGFNWDTQEMKWIYKWAQSLQERDMEIIFNGPYTFIPHAVGVQNWNKESDYMMGTDVYKKGPENAHARTDLAAERIGNFICDALEAFEAHGIHNISHLLFFTEPVEDDDAATAHDTDGSDLLPKDLTLTDIYVKFLKQTNKALEERGLRDDIKIIGPNSQENVYPNFLFVNAVLDEMDKTGVRLVDILSNHCYPRGESAISDNFLLTMDNYCMFYEQFINRYEEICDKYGWSNPEFWLDEFNTNVYGSVDGADSDDAIKSPWMATQFAAIYIHAMNYGVSNAVVWNFTNQYWPNTIKPWYSNAITQSILIQQEPYEKYYGYAILSQHLGNNGGKVYATMDDWISGMTASCVELEDGNWVFVVANTGLEDVTFEVTFEKAIGKNMYRHVYTPNMKARLDHDPIPADKGFKNVGTTLKDVSEIGSITIYTTKVMK